MHAKFFRFNHTLFRYNSTWYSLSIPSKFLLFLPLLLFQLLLTMGVKKYILFVVLHSTRVDPLSSHEIWSNMLRAQIVQFTQRRNHHATVVSLDSLEQDFVEIQGFEYVDL